MSDEYLLQVKKAVKRFPGVVALDEVDLEVKKGETLAIIGENGAGKSTLMKCLSGAYFLDSGEILLQGEQIPVITTPKERLDIGIAIIYQELSFFNDMTVAENLIMANIPVKGFLKTVDYGTMNEQAAKMLRLFNLDLKPSAMMSTLSVAEKQMIEIIRVASKDAKVIIMDEPTSSLNDVETRKLFQLITDLKGKGVSVIYISHKLDEIFAIADRVQVMRDGKRVAVLDVSATNTSELVSLMVGRTIKDMYPKEYSEIGDTVLEVENLNCSIAENISFSLKKGEILGFFGLIGSGRTDVTDALFGISSSEIERIAIDGNEIQIVTPIDAKGHGIAYIPSDRKQDGMSLVHSVKENMTVTVLDSMRKGLSLDGKKEKEYCDEWVPRMNIKTPTYNTPMDSLSGGNQQKVVIAKWLLTHPKVIMMNDPTRGIDVGAKVEIYKIMEELCKLGISIIMVSSELPETMGVADRMLVFADGKIVGEFLREEFDQHKILQLAVGGN